MMNASLYALLSLFYVSIKILLSLMVAITMGKSCGNKLGAHTLTLIFIGLFINSLIMSGSMSLSDLTEVALSKGPPAIVVLEAGIPPSNIKQWKYGAADMLSREDAEHLAYAEFNQISKSGVQSDDRVSQLRDKMRAKKAAHDTLEAAKLQAAITSSTSIQDVLNSVSSTVTVKKEPGLGPAGVLDGASPGAGTNYNRLGGSQLFSTGVTFMDPVTDKAEDSSSRVKRYLCWSKLAPSLANHAHVIEGVVRGDIATLVYNVMVLGEHAGVSGVLKAVASIVSLRKTTDTPWSAIVQAVSAARATMAQCTEPELCIHDRLVTEYLLRALDSDPRYAVEVALIRRDVPALATVLATLSTAAASIEASQVPTSSANLATRPSGTTPGKRGQCYRWRDTGSCKFGSSCSYSHTGPVKPRDPRKPKEPRGACLECGAKDHGISKCPQYISRKKAYDTATAHLAARVSAPQPVPVTAPVAATPALPSPAPIPVAVPLAAQLAATDPMAVYGVSVDTELARIMTDL